MRSMKPLFLFCAIFLASPAAMAQDIQIRGSYTEKNIEQLFDALHKNRGKTIGMNVRIAVPEKGPRFESRASHCWAQIVDTKTKRVIEWFNTDDYESGPLRRSFTAVWEIENVGKGKRRNHCGSDPKDVHAPNPGYIYALNPVG